MRVRHTGTSPLILADHTKIMPGAECDVPDDIAAAYKFLTVVETPQRRTRRNRRRTDGAPEQ